MYGVVRSREDLVDRSLLRDSAGVHDDDVVGDLGDDAEVVGDHDDRRVELLLELQHQVQDLRLRRHVERGRGLVGDQEVGLVDQRHRDHHALPHPTRELVRIVVDSLVGAGDSDCLKQLERPLTSFGPRDVAVEQHGLVELLADRVHRVQRRHRILEDHRDVVASQVAQLAAAHLEEVVALEEGLAARDRASLVVQPHDREARDALAAAGLAHDPERLPLLDLERDPVNCFDDTVVRAEARPQVAYL